MILTFKYTKTLLPTPVLLWTSENPKNCNSTRFNGNKRHSENLGKVWGKLVWKKTSKSFRTKNCKPFFLFLCWKIWNLLVREFEARGAVALQFFPSKGHKKDSSNLQQNTFTKKTLIEKSHDGDLVEKIWAGSFRKLWDWKSTKNDHYLDFFAFSAHQDFNTGNRIGDCSV